MASRQIAIRITIDNRDAINAARAQEIAMRSLNEQTDKHTHLQNGLTNSFIKGNLAARAISVTYLAVRDSLKFLLSETTQLEFTLAKVSAITGTSGEAIKALEKDLRQLSLSTGKSATELAKTALEMSKIGLTNNEVRALIGSVASLATALDEDLVRTGEVVVNILNAFGETAAMGKQRTEQLAYTVGASALSIESFSVAFSYVGATAKIAGVAFEDLTAAMDVLSNSGIRSSTIGTQLRRVIADLSDENSKASKAIGGTIESFGGLLPALEALKKATPKGGEGVSFLTEIFGRTATSVAAVLANNTDELARLSKETELATGNLDRMQKIMNDTLTGSTNRLKAAFVDLGGQLGVVVIPVLKGVADTIALMVSGITGLNRAIGDAAADTFALFSGKGKSGIGDLRTLDEENLKEQIKAFDKAQAKAKELEVESRKATTDDTLDKIKTDFEVYKTFGGAFDFANANRQLKSLADNLLKVGEAKEAVKVMRELQAINREEKKQEFSPQFRTAVRKEFQDNDFTKEVQKAISPKKREKDEATEQRMKDSMQKFVLEQEKGPDGETSNKAKMAIFDLEQKEKLAVFKKYQLDTTEFEKAQARERLEYSSRLEQQKFQMYATLAGQYVSTAAMATAALAKNYKSLGVLAKAAAIAEIAINTAVAVSKVWGQTGIYGFFAQAAPIAMGLTQAAIVSQQKFASGTDQVVRQPTMFMAGEAGAERVRVTPRNKMREDSGSGGGVTYVIQGDVYDYDKFQRKVKMAQDSNRRAFV